MVLEELRSWDAYELNTRNHARMIEQVRVCVVFPLCGMFLTDVLEYDQSQPFVYA